MSSGNINWAFGDGGDVEDLCDAADRYGYMFCSDGLWREACVRCSKIDTEHSVNDDCYICAGKGYLDEDPMDDEQMWQWIEDRRSSDAEDMALL